MFWKEVEIMLEFLQKLFIGHVHKWEIIDSAIVYDGYLVDDARRPKGTQYVLQCSHCGKIKVKKTF
jgi:hypothetical protein